jgi:hypothetical protein
MTRSLTSLRRVLVVLAVPALTAVAIPSAGAVTASPSMQQMGGGGGFLGCCPGN